MFIIPVDNWLSFIALEALRLNYGDGFLDDLILEGLPAEVLVFIFTLSFSLSIHRLHCYINTEPKISNEGVIVGHSLKFCLNLTSDLALLEKAQQRIETLDFRLWACILGSLDLLAQLRIFIELFYPVLLKFVANMEWKRLCACVAKELQGLLPSHFEVQPALFKIFDATGHVSDFKLSLDERSVHTQIFR